MPERNNRIHRPPLNLKINIDPNDYKEHLIDFLDYIEGNGDVDTYAKNICNSAATCKNALYSNNDSKAWLFNLNPCWKVDIDDPSKFGDCSAYLLIGAEIIVNNSEIQRQSLSVCLVMKGSNIVRDSESIVNSDSCCLANYNENDRIIRRFHFDIDNNSNSETPYSHLQIGGKFNSEYAPFSVHGYHYCLEHYLEIPRLLYPPVDLILVMDIILRQFSTKRLLRNNLSN